MRTLWQDLRYGVRALVKNPGFALVAVVTLALGIGANALIFSVVNAVLLRPLPFPEPERLMRVGPSWGGGADVNAADDPRFLFWREQQQSFEAMTAHFSMGAGVTLAAGGEGGEPEFVPGRKVSADFFRVLGVDPIVGRGFTAGEDQPGGERVTVIGDELARRRFGDARGAVGRTISLNGETYDVVGVMPPGFRFTNPADVFVPLRPGPGSGNSGFNLQVLARLKPGVTRDQARAEMLSIAEGLRAQNPRLMRKGESVNVVSYHDSLSYGSRPLLLILFGAVGLVLLIACANVANLQLTRAAARHKEMAVRVAMGAGKWRVARQLLTEGVLLALIGGAAGLLFAWWGAELLASLVPANIIPGGGELSFDWRVTSFALAASVATGLLFGLAPAVQVANVDLNHALKESAGKGTVGGGAWRLRGALIVAEVALTLVLSVGAILLVQTFVSLRGVAPGFDPRGVLTFQVVPSGERYETAAGARDLYRRATERLEGLPGVEGVATTNALPLDSQFNLDMAVEGKPDQLFSAEYRMISPDYFRLMRIGWRRGRELSEADAAGAAPVAVVNEAFVRRYLSDGDPLGRRLFVGRASGLDESLQIVGVVADAKQSDLAAPDPPALFVPAAQVSDGLWKFLWRYRATKFVVRAAGGEPLALGEAVKRAMLEVESNLPVTQVRSMEQIVARSIAQEQFNMTLISVFAALALLLAAIGIYGVMSYTVAQRVPEIGVRMALGARKRDVLVLILGRGAWLALLGVGIGLIGALAATRVLTSQLYGVTATDPLTFVGVAALLTAVALLACYVPARRAAKTDPLIALRYE